METGSIVLLIYLYGVLVDLASAALVVGGFGLFIIGAGFLMTMHEKDPDLQKTNTATKKIMKRIIFPALIVGGILGIFLPSERTIGLMIGAPYVVQEMQEQNTTLDRIMDKSGKAIETKLDEILKAQE